MCREKRERELERFPPNETPMMPMPSEEWEKDAGEEVNTVTRPIDVQIDAAFANGIRAALNRLAHTRRPEHDLAWKDCEAMENNRRAEIRDARK